MGGLTRWWRRFDITEQRRVKEQLDRANDKLKLYLDHAPLACVVWGADKIVREWNPAAASMFGYSAAEAIGRDVYELTATPDGLVVVDQVRAAVQAGAEYPDGIVVENRRKDGSRLRCHWHFALIGREAGDDIIVAFGIDITEKLRAEAERERLEAHLRQAQKMQSLGTLAGGIAHDFNNILLAIAGNTRLAAEDLPTDHPAQVSLGEVAKASSRASSIVNQILAFSRREEPARVMVDLRAIIEESVNLMRAALPLRVAIVTRMVSDSPIVQGDPAQIHQVLLNLATNAAHAMGESGGTLAIELDDVAIGSDSGPEQVAALSAGRYHRISVRDSGVGMDPALVERIFEPFFTTKPRGQGTGLGLSVVHGIVKAHEGTITVQSKEGEGSTFQVYLPAAKGRVKTTSQAAAVPRGEGQRILYVDDEEPLVYLVTRVLDRLGYRVSGYCDASAALEHFLAGPDDYAAVVTDLSMPVLSGADLARRILQVRPDLPVIMTSGYVSAADREAAMRSGVRELLLKPNTIEELGQVLHRLLAEAAPPMRFQATAAGSKIT